MSLFFVKNKAGMTGKSPTGRMSMKRVNQHDGAGALTLMQTVSSQYGRKERKKRPYRD
jgi:hypothetical protein